MTAPGLPFYVFFVILMVLLGNAGYILAHAWLRQSRDKQVRLVAIISLFLTILPFLLQWGVWTKVDSYAQVIEAGADYYDWMQPPFHYGWAAIMRYITVATLLMGIWMKRRGNVLIP
ncbi:MAG: hypothetical protein ABW168_29645 [Sedimenticola sp.]